MYRIAIIPGDGTGLTLFRGSGFSLTQVRFMR